MRVTISTTKNQRIPHLINGCSANALFYLVNFETMFKNRAYDDGIEGEFANSTTPSLPYDIDDFARIMNVYHYFKWTKDDIETAKKNAKKLKFGKKFLVFLDNFMVLKTFYDDGEEGDEELKELLDDIHYGKETADDEMLNELVIGDFK